ncbi:membrane fusion protein (multidrug efflux system) [Rhodothalassium salexigens DSM 2132]|uniref:Membrane fusion protein (Multidrug efflux system) n=1 Tax=Rhodothalassium salexigens DSM 2132 TaxID=1188247 RepID=A0A4R2PGQ9_RHOSA|nr:efflux RND transporter periplasmic adaptor subunit [Rhodothalassium salexigens]MBB4211495.1 membrane fusion protein (multidrug efflux system) [Rhodothalassium salexigens DSM 2132]MBK1640017.1 efflux transporter periplasmic adaptor subunit [Rhodothalassium salexigens DSM 2132]TCP34573.1 membrane fusion protein (multidrug efflux system) [Rhodothalassium salexigens DSM 2132]
MTRPFADRPLLVTSLCILIGLTACQPTPEGDGGEHHHGRLVVSQPIERDVAITRDYVAQIHSSRHIEIAALEPGYLETVAVQEGQRVKKGQAMFKILPLTYQAELERAAAETQAARVEYDNTERLTRNDVVSDSELALAKAKYQRAKAEQQLAQTHLGFTDIKAPFSGIMDRLEMREGSLVEEGDLLTTLSDNSHMWVYFNIPEAEYLDYASSPEGVIGREVRLLMANNKLFDEPGTITTIEATFNNQTGTIPFRADFPNPTGLLRHGQTGNILLTTQVPDALLVPQKATFEVLDHTYVFVVDADNVVHQRRVHIGEELEDLFVIDGGLEEDERILLEGLRQVRDGQHIDFTFEPPAAAFADLKLPAE